MVHDPVRVQYMSDLHVEYGSLLGPDDVKTDADIVILAGDIANAVNVSSVVASLFPAQTVIVIPGNHEPYGRRCGLDDVMSQIMEDFQISRGTGHDHYFLNDDVVDIHVRDRIIHIAGTTLFSDFDIHNERDRDSVACSMMSDFRRVYDASGRLATPADYRRRFRKSKRFLTDFLSGNDHDTNIVVSHFLPSAKCIAPEYRHVGAMNAMFASDLDDLIDTHGPDLWIHGHTHSTTGYIADNGCRVVCNPAGYPDMKRRSFQNINFDARKVVEI